MLSGGFKSTRNWPGTREKSEETEKSSAKAQSQTRFQQFCLGVGAGEPIGQSYRLAINQLAPWCECSDQWGLELAFTPCKVL